MNKAIEFVMKFYDVSREDTLEYYMDEVEAFISLKQRGLFNETQLPSEGSSLQSSLEDEDC